MIYPSNTEFWNWMEKQEYSIGTWLIRPYVNGFKEQKIKEPTKQMLIGYMIEYLGLNKTEDLYNKLFEDIECNRKKDDSKMIPEILKKWCEILKGFDQVSPGKIPYTYHHDFIRELPIGFNLSRGDVAHTLSKKKDNQTDEDIEIELYSLCLYFIFQHCSDSILYLQNNGVLLEDINKFNTFVREHYGFNSWSKLIKKYNPFPPIEILQEQYRR